MKLKFLPCAIFLLSLCTVFSVFISGIHAASVPVTVPVSFDVSEEDGRLKFNFTDENGAALFDASIEKELPEFGGLFTVDEGYAAVFASAYPANYRIVFYDPEFLRIASTDIGAPEAALPFIYGNCAFTSDEDGYYLAVLNLLNTPVSDIEFIGDEVFVLDKDLDPVDTRIRIYDIEDAENLKISVFKKDGIVYELTENDAADTAGLTALSLNADGQAASESLSISGCADKFAELKTLSDRSGKFCLHLLSDGDPAGDEAFVSEDAKISEDTVVLFNDLSVQDVSETEDTVTDIRSPEINPVQDEIILPSSETVLPAPEFIDTDAAEDQLSSPEGLFENESPDISPMTDSVTADENAVGA